MRRPRQCRRSRSPDAALAHGPFDTTLAERGLARTVAVPTYTGAAHIVLNSGLIGPFPERHARQHQWLL